MFHTDRDSEFKNKLIDEALEIFGIQGSLSMKGCPYDNVVAESMFNIVKTEFTKQAHIVSLNQFEFELNDYVNCYNIIRIHGTQEYKSPLEYRFETL